MAGHTSKQPKAVNLNRIEIFREVASAGSFTKAASRLKQPKSRISRNISALEDELGVQLIHRSSRQFQLTEAGKQFYARTRSVMEQMRDAIEEVSQTIDEVSGVIRISVADDIGQAVMPDICREFQRAYPKVRIEMQLTNAYVDLIAESFDIAIRIGRLKDSALVQKKLGEITLAFAASPDFVRSFGEPQQLADLSEFPFLGFTPLGSFQQTLQLTNGKEKKTLKLGATLITNNFFVLKTMALRGAGITYLPKFVMSDDLQRGTLVQVMKQWSSDGVPIQLVLPPQKDRPIRIKKFIDFISQNFPQKV